MINQTFFVDAMLGNVAKKLRILGFDSLYSAKMGDEEILAVSKKENRILITKDEQLAQKAKKNEILVIHITTSDEINQFLQINENIHLRKFVVRASNSRCPVCNGELQYIEKNDVSEKVPLGVFKNMSDFWRCNACEKIYWEGTHIKNLKRFTAELNDKL